MRCPAWRATPWRERAAVLFRAAAIMRRRRAELAALEVFEAGKPQPEADADVCEAIDFCEYYGREALRLAAGAPVAAGAGRDERLPLPAARHRCRDRAVELPARDPDAAWSTAALVTGNCRALQAGRADARRRAPPGRDPARGRRCRPARSPSCRASARRSAPTLVEHPDDRVRRVHRLEGGRPLDRASGGRRTVRGSGT